MKVTIQYSNPNDALPLLAVSSFIPDCTVELSTGSSFTATIDSASSTSPSSALKTLTAQITGNDNAKVCKIISAHKCRAKEQNMHAEYD